MPKKWMIDIDECLLEFMPDFLDCYNARNFQRHGKKFRKEDIHSYDFWRIFGIGEAELTSEVDFFYESDKFRKLGASEGASELLGQLNGDAVAVTARPEHTRRITQYNLRLRFGELAPSVFFAEPYTPLLKRDSIIYPTKVEICLNQGVKYAVEDSLSQVIRLAEAGIKVFLVTQPWNRNALHLPKGVKRVKSLREIVIA